MFLLLFNNFRQKFQNNVESLYIKVNNTVLVMHWKYHVASK